VIQKFNLRLSSPIQYIKGIGPKRARYFKKLGIEIVRDLLLLVPRRYVDYSTILNIRDLKINDEATVVGKIELIERQKTKRRGHLLKVLLSDDTDAITLTWFNRPDLNKKFHTGDWLIVSGKVSFFYGKQLVNPLYEIIEEEETQQKMHGSIIPIYPLTEGLRLWDIKRAVQYALQSCSDEIIETIPHPLLNKNNLLPLADALRYIHAPPKLEDAIAGRRRLVYDEFFFFELMLAKRKAKRVKEDGISLKEKKVLTKKFVERLPFSLTHGQSTVIDTIVCDMEKPQPMNRLLQGDVGSGKTVIALYAMLVAIENDYQSVLMAPTEILAEQHYINLSDLFMEIGINATLLTSSIKTKEKEEIIHKIACGEAKLIIGTHALIEENIVFRNLGLAVIDEQHRFGVMQRAALVNKGVNPDFLVLSATPIPRTLALTLYGDLDISILKEKPPRRGEVITKIINEREKNRIYQSVNAELNRGRQAFVICPIIEKSEKLELTSVNESYREISSFFTDHSVGVIHGRLATDERLKMMDAFRRGRLDILVATTVVEVGVDIPNATVMIIEHPERFGLAQLHQLRGRIGRGAQKSFCYLFLDRFVAPETYERLCFFENNNDGFALAQKDIALRGPGEILGQRQHGLPDIKIGNLEYDQDLLILARDDAFELVNKDPEIRLDENRPIRRQLNTLRRKENLLRIG
jgi:ATP-dependent DNA helicase RecG